jgi:predicted P-loop ATPase
MHETIWPQHAEHLAGFGISIELLRSAGVTSLTDTETRELLGINGSHGDHDLGGILIPYLHPASGERNGARVRLDEPILDGPKYLMEAGCRHLFFAPSSAAFLKDTSVAVIFAEAEKSALALAALSARSRRRYLAVAIGGCYGWKRKCGKRLMPDGSSKTETGPSPDLDLIHFRGRHALIAFDSNVLTNPKVRAARKAFQKELVARGASVAFVEIPAEAGINGPDDFISERSDDAMLEAIDKSRGEAETLRQLLTDTQGRPKASLANAITILRDATAWAGVLAFNEFSISIVTRKPTPWGKPADSKWTNTDDIYVADFLQRNGVDVNSRTATEAVQVVAEINKFHPVKDYLDALRWDDKERIDRWLTKYLGVEDTEFSRAIGPRWLISGIARIYEPGCKADHTLVLISAIQGRKKSTALQVLAVRGEWFTDRVSNLENKDAMLELHGAWIVEHAELSSIKRSMVEKVKSFLTATKDRLRLPYGRRVEDFQRTNIFAGTTNDDEMLNDETGGRRFWPVHCGEIDLNMLREDRDQLWAEAAVRYRAGDPWWLETQELNQLASEEQDKHYEEGQWDDTILRWLENPEQRSEPNGVPITPFDSSRDAVTVTDILIHAVGKDIKSLLQRDRIQVVRCLRHNRWSRVRKRVVDHGSSEGEGEKRRPGFYVRVEK